MAGGGRVGVGAGVGGGLNGQRLPPPRANPSTCPGTHTAPTTPCEQQLAEITSVQTEHQLVIRVLGDWGNWLSAVPW